MGGEKWKTNVLLTVFLCPGCVSIYIIKVTTHPGFTGWPLLWGRRKRDRGEGRRVVPQLILVIRPVTNVLTTKTAVACNNSLF